MQGSNAAAHHGVKNVRTLLVDPDTQTRQATELELSVRGQAVDGHNAAASALSAFHDNVFHIVMISNHLPDGHALQLCRDIRALPGGDAVSIIVVGHGLGDTDRVAAIDAGADDAIRMVGEWKHDARRPGSHRSDSGRPDDFAGSNHSGGE